MLRGKAVAQPGGSRAARSVPQKRGRSPLSDLVLRAVELCAARKGASLAFIKKTLAMEGYDVVRNGGRVKAAVNALLDKGLLQRVTGSGVAGSFRIGKERVAGAGRRGRAAGEARQRPAGKTKRPRRPGKATVQRLKKPGRSRAKAAVAAAEEAAGGTEEAGGPAAVAEGEL